MRTASTWIWYPGDFEIYHHLQVSLRREERDYRWPAFWRVDDCFHNVRFRKIVDCNAPEEMMVFAHGVGHVLVNGKKHPFKRPITLLEGQHEIVVLVANPEGLPCIYVEGVESASGTSWEANEFGREWLPAGCNGLYRNREEDPNHFAFQYKRIVPISVERKKDGIVYDYGRETFAVLEFGQVEAAADIHLFYGESLEEALDTEHSTIIDTIPAGSTSYRCTARAFRYLYIRCTEQDAFEMSAWYEYLPFNRMGSFNSSNELLNRIWETAAYTFHLNSREFFLDGIKRDRWVWSGDAYQSYMINNYLYFDADITKRTIIALRGKDPIAAHTNTIVDYSFYWIMSVHAYYQATKDLEFVSFIYPRMKTMMDYCISRTDEDGFIRGRDGDWVFVDWAEYDRTGAVCAEQMLLAESLKAAWACGELLGVGEADYLKRAEQLKEQINARYWDDEHGAYIDSFESGRRNVTRHANIFAILLRIADDRQRASIIQNVLLNNEIPHIKTPYFAFYELEVMCQTGQLEHVTKRIEQYWGGMLALGATTFWEEYNPSVTGLDHYGMYGERYGKSLCHAWGASPIYLLGRYYLGVHPTSAGYETFVVEPKLGGLERIEGTAPVNGGVVALKMTSERLHVMTDKNGGTVRINGKEYPLKKDIPFVLEIGAASS